jgi:hypothetical protein
VTEGDDEVFGSGQLEGGADTAEGNDEDVFTSCESLL